MSPIWNALRRFCWNESPHFQSGRRESVSRFVRSTWTAVIRSLNSGRGRNFVFELTSRPVFGNIKAVMSVGLKLIDFTVVFKEELLLWAEDHVSPASDYDNVRKVENFGLDDFPDQGEVFGFVAKVEVSFLTKRTSVRCKERHSIHEETLKNERRKYTNSTRPTS